MGAAAAWAVPAVISVIGGLYSGNRANKANQMAGENAKKQDAIRQQVEPAAKQLVGSGVGAMGQGLSYYSSMLANPREASAPEQNRINSLYAGQAANVRNKMGRGGYGPADAEKIRSQQRAATEGVIQSGRPQAAGAEVAAGANMTGLGFQGYGLGSGILQNVFQNGMAARREQAGMGESAGTGLFGAYQNYLLGQALKQPGTSTTPGGGGNGGFNFSTAYQPPASSTPPSGWSGMAGSGLYGGATPNSGPSGRP